MATEIRQAALCVFHRGDHCLFVEITDPTSGSVFHRPPGGGMEKNETPEIAVRRELQEEMGLALTHITALGFIDHFWFWKARKVQERAWIFLADSADYPALQLDQPLNILEADGKQHPLVWRDIYKPDATLPSICPSRLEKMLQSHLRSRP